MTNGSKNLDTDKKRDSNETNPFCIRNFIDQLDNPSARIEMG